MNRSEVPGLLATSVRLTLLPSEAWILSGPRVRYLKDRLWVVGRNNRRDAWSDAEVVLL